MIAKERICVTADGQCVVPDGHPDARRLVAGEGCEIEDKAVKQYGLRDGKLPRDWGLRHQRWLQARERAAAQVETKG